MKKYIYILTVLSFIIGLTSCEETLLDKEPLDIISENVLWEDEQLIERYLDGIFEDMVFMFSESSPEPGALVERPWSELDIITVSDEARHCFPWYPTYTRWGRGLIDESGGFMEDWLYPTIRKVNEMLEKMQDSSLDEDIKRSLITKAKWARAMCYFQMVKKYGGVPIITTAQKIDAPYEELFVSRNKEMDVYDFVIQEMDEIAPLMLETERKGYPSKWAAYALKSRAALYAASIATWGSVQIEGLVGIPATEASRYWQTSYDASEKIINEGGPSLYNKYSDDKVHNYRQLFIDEDNNPESIFALEFEGGSGVGRAHGYDLMTGPQGFVPWAGSSAAVYLDMVEAFENVDGTTGTFDREKYEQGLWTPKEIFGNKDPRFHATVATQSTPWQGSQVEYYTHLVKPDGEEIQGIQNSFNGVPATGNGNLEQGGVTGFTVLKYVNESKIMPGIMDSDTDWMVFRFGEILLNHAEACIELGKIDEALSLVNQIRDRAGMPLLTSIDREMVRHERRIELAFENAHRWFDLRRWRTAVEAISKDFKGLNYKLDYNSYAAGNPKYKISVIDNVDGAYKKNFPERMYYLPITANRISNNPNLAPENPGY
jgi:starch-binding outer membrane protein, SusD/RagB family